MPRTDRETDNQVEREVVVVIETVEIIAVVIVTEREDTVHQVAITAAVVVIEGRVETDITTKMMIERIEIATGRHAMIGTVERVVTVDLLTVTAADPINHSIVTVRHPLAGCMKTQSMMRCSMEEGI
jgi:hypothetical protein